MLLPVITGQIWHPAHSFFPRTKPSLSPSPIYSDLVLENDAGELHWAMPMSLSASCLDQGREFPKCSVICRKTLICMASRCLVLQKEWISKTRLRIKEELSLSIIKQIRIQKFYPFHTLATYPGLDIQVSCRDKNKTLLHWLGSQPIIPSSHSCAGKLLGL